MDFSAELDKLQQHVADAKSEAQSAATETRGNLHERIDKAQADLDSAAKNAKQQAEQAAVGARNEWAQMKADAAARMGDAKARMDKRTSQLDSKGAAVEADWAEADAGDALDFAALAVDNARLAILEAISTRAHADERARKLRALELVRMAPAVSAPVSAAFGRTPPRKSPLGHWRSVLATPGVRGGK